AAVATAEAKLALLRNEKLGAFAEWRKLAPPAEKLAVPGLLGQFPFEEIKDGKVANLANEKEPGAVQDDVSIVPGKAGHGLELSGENNVNFAIGGGFTRDDAFS